MFCTHCGTPAKSKRFCTQCGYELRKVQIPTTPAAKSGGSHSNKKTPADIAKPEFLDALIGQTIDHRYRLESRLGFGGMGTVYRAKRVNIGDTAAVKILNPEHVTDPNAVERFHREAQVGARLKHPNAVRVYDFGISEDELVYFVMELVEGKNLREVINENGQLSQTAATSITVQICSALDEAHRQNVVHRDLKPENIIVQTTSTGYRVKVLDFGIASLRNLTVDNLMHTGSIVGTPHYMSPEQCLGKEVDRRSDIYSLGIILYEMLAGLPPFKSTTPAAIMRQQIYRTPPSLGDLNPSVSPEVETVVMHALEKRPEARPQTASALAQELMAAMRSDQPALSQEKTVVEKVSEIPPPGAIRTANKSNRFVRLSISMLLLLAGIASVGHGWSTKNNGKKQQPTAVVETSNDSTAVPLLQKNIRPNLVPQVPGDRPDLPTKTPPSNGENVTDPDRGKPIEKPILKIKTGPSLPSAPGVKIDREITQKRNTINRRDVLKNGAIRERASQNFIRPGQMSFKSDDSYRSSLDSISSYYRDGYWMTRRRRRYSK